ncbi:MAG: hypothetical protein ACP5E4_01805 [Candidatus Aenigmatarchaeota archaeon]
MDSPKGQLALDMVVKFVIVLIVAAIVIAMFVSFKDNAKKGVSEMFGDKVAKSEFPKTFEQTSFSAGEIANYIESCHDAMTEIPEVEQEDGVCYVLMANTAFSSFVDASTIQGALDPKIRQKVSFRSDLKKTHLKIEFIELNDIVAVS